MTHRFEPFTPDAFNEETGFDATDNDAIYLRWVNSQINYANYLAMKDMSNSLRDIKSLLKNSQEK